MSFPLFCVVLCVSFSVSGGVSSGLLKRYAFGLLLIHKTLSVLPLVVGFFVFPKRFFICAFTDSGADELCTVRRCGCLNGA